MTEFISKDIIDLQDIEKVQFLQSLQNDPAKYAAYVSEKKGRITTEAIDTKRASFMKVASDMAKFMDMDNNSRATLSRTTELSKAQAFLIDEQVQREAVAKQNEDSTRRQVEINEWYYESKRETLFLLQVILLMMLTITVLVAMASYGLITQLTSNYLTGIVLLIGLGTWGYRWYYTQYVRDRRYWNRRMFKKDVQETQEVCAEDLAEAAGPQMVPGMVTMYLPRLVPTLVPGLVPANSSGALPLSGTS
jgi:hypothetical protein